MVRRFLDSDQIALLPVLLKWLAISILIALLAGSASAFFLASLDWATSFRESHRWIIVFLPLSGFFVGWIFLKLGRSVEAGNNLLLEEIHNPKSAVPFRMTPLILFGTIISHVFGASVGREGTAVQMGGALADQLTRPLRLRSDERRTLLMAGISAGFASVFGTPLAGAIFGLEVLSIGKLRYDAIFPCFFAAIIADQVTLLWGIHHTHYTVPYVPVVSALTLTSAVVAGALCGILGMLFAKSTHLISATFKKYIRYSPFRPAIGGVCIVAATSLLGSSRYLGLGIPVIQEAFSRHIPPLDFIGKFLFTVLALGSGFKGGEVTPLFFIGSTLGNSLSSILPFPSAALAAIGFVAIFAGAANTPLASTLMAIELFGGDIGIFAGVACVSSFLLSGHSSIYHAQRIGVAKVRADSTTEGVSLSVLQEEKNLLPIDIFRDINFMGKLRSKETSEMTSQLASLRIYFSTGMKLKREGFWRRIMARPLGSFLATQAKSFGVEQAVLYRVSGGYLKDGPLVFDAGEIPPTQLPSCVELIDRESVLRNFLTENRTHLQGTRLVLLRAQEPLLDGKLEHPESHEILNPFNKKRTPIINRVGATVSNIAHVDKEQHSAHDSLF